MAQSVDIAEFERQLRQSRRDFEFLNPGNSQYAHFRFCGPFAQQTVIWDAHLYTLEYYLRQIQQLRSSCSSRQFILIQKAMPEPLFKVEIGLNLAVIDEPAIRKTMTMLRQYKRLKEGRHDFGSLVRIDL